MLWCDICHLKELLVDKGVMSGQGNPVFAMTVTYGAGIGLTVRENFIENLIIMGQDVPLQIGVVFTFTDLTAFKTLRTPIILMSLDCTLGIGS